MANGKPGNTRADAAGDAGLDFTQGIAMKAREVNFDGLVGLTHHYAGLSFGNEASTKHRFQVSNPKLAAKQGLLK
jgi:hypothetical protein